MAVDKKGKNAKQDLSFAIEVRRIELEEDIRMLLTAAQDRQKMINA